MHIWMNYREITVHMSSNQRMRKKMNQWKREKFEWINLSFKFWNIYIFIPGPRVLLSENIINFSQIDLGCSVNKTLEIINESDVEAAYQVSSVIFTGRNEVVAKVMCLQASAILLTGVGGLPQCMLGYHPPPPMKEAPLPKGGNPLGGGPPPPEGGPPGKEAAPPPPRHTVNEWPVRILLECILVWAGYLHVDIGGSNAPLANLFHFPAVFGKNLANRFLPQTRVGVPPPPPPSGKSCILY